MRVFNFLLFATLLIVCSCRTERGSINNYLQNLDSAGKVQVFRMPEALIQKNDLLSIKVYSMSADPRTDQLYNLPEAATESGSTTNGFLVDVDGNIEYPRVGKLKAEGLTKNELAQVVREHLETVLKSPSVIVRFLNYKITVLGEVRAPGSFNTPTERVTILEALGLAGDISDYGNKNTVRVAREKDGQIEMGYVDLTSQALFTSPYFRLQQNDVVFVEQNRRKYELQDRQNIMQQISIVTAVITTVAIIINLIR
jgi:polysaccharide export outer membrane protein